MTTKLKPGYKLKKGYALKEQPTRTIKTRVNDMIKAKKTKLA